MCQFARDGTGFSTLHVFDGVDSANPSTRLLQLSDDVFVGTAENGAECGQGSLYQFSFSGSTVDGSTDCGPKKKDSGGGSTGLGLLVMIGLLGLSRRIRGQSAQLS